MTLPFTSFFHGLLQKICRSWSPKQYARPTAVRIDSSEPSSTCTCAAPNTQPPLVLSPERGILTPRIFCAYFLRFSYSVGTANGILSVRMASGTYSAKTAAPSNAASNPQLKPSNTKDVIATVTASPSPKNNKAAKKHPTCPSRTGRLCAESFSDKPLSPFGSHPDLIPAKVLLIPKRLRPNFVTSAGRKPVNNSY